MKKKRRILSTFLAACMVTTCMAGMSVPASADGDTSYTITIPSALTVTGKGWNSIGNISASGTLADGKKLTVSAASANSWALTSTSDSVSYTLKNASTDNAATTSWEFTSLPASQAIGIDVSDYSTKPAGTYTDTVTFTAKVEDAAPATITVTINQSDWGGWGRSFTKDGVTVSARIIDPEDGNLMSGGTFSTTLGNFTKIVVTTASCEASGTGWSGNYSSMTWAGTPASTVPFSGNFMGLGNTQTTIVCTIEPTN